MLICFFLFKLLFLATSFRMNILHFHIHSLWYQISSQRNLKYSHYKVHKHYIPIFLKKKKKNPSYNSQKNRVCNENADSILTVTGHCYKQVLCLCAQEQICAVLGFTNLGTCITHLHSFFFFKKKHWIALLYHSMLLITYSSADMMITTLI